jgi:hypothetical protein
MTLAIRPSSSTRSTRMTHSLTAAHELAMTQRARASQVKFYVRGIGTVLEQTVNGGDERNTLISVRHG